MSQTASGLCPRTVTRTYSIADSCGNASSCTQDFVVDDTQAPSITCPAGTTVECFGDLPLAYTTLAQFITAGGTATLLQTAGGPDWPRVRKIEMTGEYPFATLQFRDEELPVNVELTAFSPFAPLPVTD